MTRYRQDSHWLSLLAWAILCTAAAGGKRLVLRDADRFLMAVSRRVRVFES